MILFYLYIRWRIFFLLLNKSEMDTDIMLGQLWLMYGTSSLACFCPAPFVGQFRIPIRFPRYWKMSGTREQYILAVDSNTKWPIPLLDGDYYVLYKYIARQSISSSCSIYEIYFVLADQRPYLLFLLWL